MKRFFALLCLFSLVLCVPARAVELDLNAPSAILMEKATGTVQIEVKPAE